MAYSGVYGDTQFTNVLYGKFLGFADALLGDWQLMVDRWITELDIHNWYQFQSSSVNVTSLRGTLRQSSGAFLDTTRGADISGGGAVASTPADAAIVISWNTTLHRRGGKPRTYIPGVTFAEMATEKHVDSESRLDIATRANQFLSGIDAIGGEVAPFTDVKLGTVLYQLGGAWRTPPVFEPYIGAFVHSRFGTQRRRLGDWTP
jgi:hypothetical protein